MRQRVQQDLPAGLPDAWARRPRARSYAWIGAVAAALLLVFGLAGFSRAAAKAAEAGCSGALCAEPIVAVVDDPKVPLYQSLEAFAAFDGEAGCWEALADLGGSR